MSRFAGWAWSIREKWKSEGLIAWVRRNLRLEAWPRIYNRQRILWLEKDLSGEIQPLRPRIPVEIRVLSPPDDDLVPFLREATKTSRTHTSTSISRPRQQAWKYYLGLHDGSTVASLGVSIGNQRLGDVTVKALLPSDEFYLFQLYTLPEYRGQRLIAALVDQASRDCKAKGFRTASMAVHHYNEPMLRAAAFLGFSVQSVVSRYRVFPNLRLHVFRTMPECRATLKPENRGAAVAVAKRWHTWGTWPSASDKGPTLPPTPTSVELHRNTTRGCSG